MITQLTGRLIEKNPTNLVIDCGGVGYEVKISLNTFSRIGSDENIRVYTQLIVREDAQLLYGFVEPLEREMFNLLISISGIGPNTAMIMLSSLVPGEIAQAILTDDVRTIQGVKGIGVKTAQRVIVELKDKMLKFEGASEILSSTDNTERKDALTALISLGFDKKNAEKAIERIANGGETVEQLIKAALKIL
jgi:Holliday junction DNA helicase RuvA